jgi:hypothetical protein
MTDQETARKIVMYVQQVNEADAIEYVATHLLLIRTQGERAGIEQAMQAINLLTPAE